MRQPILSGRRHPKHLRMSFNDRSAKSAFLVMSPQGCVTPDISRSHRSNPTAGFARNTWAPFRCTALDVEDESLQRCYGRLTAVFSVRHPRHFTTVASTPGLGPIYPNSPYTYTAARPGIKGTRAKHAALYPTNKLADPKNSKS